jgi:hypothetical protein
MEESFDVFKKTFGNTLKSETVRSKDSQKKCDENVHFEKPVGG